MDIVRPFAGPLFRSYRGLTEVPELAPSVLDSETRVGVNFCLSMMKLNSLQQYRTVRYLPLNDGGYGALHVAVTPGQFGQPLVRSWLEVARPERKKVLRLKRRKPEEPLEGLFIINNRWLLEPDPAAVVSGALVGTVSGWRLFDTDGKVFKPGQQYNGFCTQSTDGKTQHAVWIYEDEAGKKFIAQNGAFPYQEEYIPPEVDPSGGEFEEVYEDEIVPVVEPPENGALMAVPPEAQVARLGCWFWYADNTLMGSYASGYTEDGWPIESPLLEKSETNWSSYTLSFLEAVYVQQWVVGFPQGASMSLDGTQLVWSGTSNSNGAFGVIGASVVVNFKDKNVFGYYHDEDYSSADPIPICLWKRESLIMNDGVVIDVSYDYDYESEPPGLFVRYAAGTGPYPQYQNDYWVITSNSWQYADRVWSGYRTRIAANSADAAFPYIWNEKVTYNDYIERYENTPGVYTWYDAEAYFGSVDTDSDVFMLFAPELGIVLNNTATTKDTGYESTTDSVCKITLNGDPIVPAKSYSFTIDTPLENQSVQDDLTAISAVTTDLCALALYQACSGHPDTYTYFYDYENPQLFGIKGDTFVDLTALLGGSAEFKTDVVEIARKLYLHEAYSGLEWPDDRYRLQVPATRGRAFTAAE